MGMNDEEIWQSDHKGQKGESRYRVGYGEVNDLGGEDKTLFKLHENFCPPVLYVSYFLWPNLTVRVLGQLCQFVSYGIPTPLDTHKRKGVKKGSRARRARVRPRDMNLH